MFLITSAKYVPCLIEKSQHMFRQLHSDG